MITALTLIFIALVVMHRQANATVRDAMWFAAKMLAASMAGAAIFILCLKYAP